MTETEKIRQAVSAFLLARNATDIHLDKSFKADASDNIKRKTRLLHYVMKGYWFSIVFWPKFFDKSDCFVLMRKQSDSCSGHVTIGSQPNTEFLNELLYLIESSEKIADQRIRDHIDEWGAITPNRRRTNNGSK